MEQTSLKKMVGNDYFDFIAWKERKTLIRQSCKLTGKSW